MPNPVFHSLVVKDLFQTISDAMVVEFDIPEALKPKFKFTQGQFLTLEAEINGELVRRSYSLCSSPLDNSWKIGVKLVPNGKFSTFVNKDLKIGDRIKVMTPQGNFHVAINKEQQNNYVAFAAGSGITPILSIIKTHLEAEPKATFKLFYLNQTVSSIMFKEELEALKNQYLERFEVFYFLSRQNRAVPLFNGRFTIEKLDIIFKSICNKNFVDAFFSCGPEAMVMLISDYLKSNGVEPKKIHFELFGTPGKVNRKTTVVKSGKSCEVTIIEGGKSMNFELEQGGDNILDGALNNSADLPYACKGGVCSTCKAKLVEGDVEMLLSYGLEPDEVKAGYILTCQSYPKSKAVTVDFDS